MKLTQKNVRAVLALASVAFSRIPGEDYRVRVKGSPEGHGYFTTDLRDALDTGLAMARPGERNLAPTRPGELTLTRAVELQLAGVGTCITANGRDLDLWEQVANALRK